jgi:hypothetical protein
MNTPIVVTVLSWGLWSVACANSSDDPYHACASGWTRCIDANTCVPADSPCPPSSMTVASGPATSDASAPTSDAGNPTPTAYAAGPWAGGDWSEHFPQSPASSPDAGVLPPASTALSWSQVYLDVGESDIVSIWGTSNADVYVGTDLGAIYHVVNGYATRTYASSQVIGAGWGSDPHSVYAVGASAWLAQAGLTSTGGLFQYQDSSSWDAVASGTLYSVWGSSSDDVYAVGEVGVLHATAGGAFTSEPLAGAAALAVWGSGAADVYVTSATPQGTILHSTGDSNWQPVYTEIDTPWDVWGSGPGDVYAVFSPTGPNDPPAHIVHSLPGAGWVTESVGQPGTLLAVWGSGANDVYAAGWHPGGAAGSVGDLYHSVGDGQWTEVELPGSAYQVRCVWGSSATDVYVVTFDLEDGPVLWHGQP